MGFRARAHRYLPYLGLLAFFLALGNFFWLATEVSSQGDAMSGYVQDGHYFLKWQGGYREVSQSTFEWIRFHTTSILVTHLLGIMGAAWYSIAIQFPSMVKGSASPSWTRARVQHVASSGGLIAQFRCSGRIGKRFRWSGPLMHVSVYRTGIVLKPLFMAPHAVLANEIDSLDKAKGFLSAGVRIEHKGVDVATPITLWITKAHRVEALMAWNDHARANPAPVEDWSIELPPPLSSAASVEPRPHELLDGFRILAELIGTIAVAVIFIWVAVSNSLLDVGPFSLVWIGLLAVITMVNIRRILQPDLEK